MLIAMIQEMTIVEKTSDTQDWEPCAIFIMNESRNLQSTKQVTFKVQTSNSEQYLLFPGRKVIFLCQLIDPFDEECRTNIIQVQDTYQKLLEVIMISDSIEKLEHLGPSTSFHHFLKYY